MNASRGSLPSWVPRVEQDAQGRRHVRVDGRTFLVYQIYYDEYSRRRVNPLWTPHENVQASPFFEAAVIADLLGAGHQRTADYFGVFSWKFAAKIPLTPLEMFRRILRDGCEADGYSFFGRLKAGPLWPLAERKHPGILRAATLLMRRLDIDADLTRLETPRIYQNHFLCRSSLYERFGLELLRPALNAMSDRTDVLLQAVLRQDAHYRDPRVPESQLMAIFGQPHFCLQPFIAERLFSTWLALNPGVRVRQIWRGRFVEAGKVPVEPEMRTSRAESE